MEFEGRSRISLHLNMAPLMDVILLLLIFFMLTNTYMVAEAIDLDLPFSSSSRPVEVTDLTVYLDADGLVYVNEEMIGRDGLRAKLEALIVDPNNQTITLKTDAEESVQDMIEVMDIIRTAGGIRVLIATEGEQTR